MKRFVSGFAMCLFLLSPALAAEVVLVPSTIPGNLPILSVDDAKENVIVHSKKDLSTQYNESVFSVYNDSKERFKVRPDGATVWNMRSGTAEAGRVAIATPGGGVGLALFPSTKGEIDYTDIVRFDMAAYLGNVTTLADITKEQPGGIFHMGFNKAYYGAYLLPDPQLPKDSGISIRQYNNFVGINTHEPKARLEIKDGGLRINNATPPADADCNADTRGTFWVTIAPTENGDDAVQVCLRKNGVYKWKYIIKGSFGDTPETGDTPQP